LLGLLNGFWLGLLDGFSLGLLEGFWLCLLNGDRRLPAWLAGWLLAVLHV